MASAATLLCNFLSATVITSCLILKVPQIFSVAKQKSSKGLSLSSVLLELCSYSTMLTYHFAMNYPLTTYLEYCFLVPQDVVLLLLVLHFKGALKINTLPFLALYVGVCYALAFRLVPDAVLTTCISLVTPVSASSKILQLTALARSRDAGTVSSVTWAIATYSTLSRSITTMVQTGDVAVLMNFSISFLLNVTMTSTIVYLRYTKPKQE